VGGSCEPLPLGTRGLRNNRILVRAAQRMSRKRNSFLNARATFPPPLPPPRSHSLSLSLSLFHTRPRLALARGGSGENGATPPSEARATLPFSFQTPIINPTTKSRRKSRRRLDYNRDCAHKDTTLSLACRARARARGEKCGGKGRKKRKMRSYAFFQHLDVSGPRPSPAGRSDLSFLFRE